MLYELQAQPSSDCGKSNFPTVNVQGPLSVKLTLIINTIKTYQYLYKVESTRVHSKKSLLIVKLGSFQNVSFEIKQISFFYQKNRLTITVVLMIADLILAFVKVGLVYNYNIYII